VGKPTDVQQRQEFYERYLQGESYLKIADETGYAYETVRKWCRRQRDRESIETRYHRASNGPLSTFAPAVRYVILRLRLEHPGWGPGFMRYHLQQRASLSGMALPSVASMGRYLNQWERFRRLRKGKQRGERPHQPTQVHQRWQIDFKENIVLEGGIQLSMYTVRDPVGAATLRVGVIEAGPAGRRGRRYSLPELRQIVRTVAAEWGTLPQEIQTDNEPVFVGDTVDPFPSKFTLYLCGLDVQHLTIRPGMCTDNAEVERCHRTVFAYALAGQLHLPLPQLQQLLDQRVHELNFELPSHAHGCNGLPPVQAHPELLSKPRPFSPERELALFSLDRVDAFLATSTWRRKVNKNGQINIGGHGRRYSVGRPFARQYVLVCFDPSDRHFVFYPDETLVDGASPTGDELGRRPARHLDVQDLTGVSPYNSLYTCPQPGHDSCLH
jgi:transposase InsO family protein